MLAFTARRAAMRRASLGLVVLACVALPGTASAQTDVRVQGTTDTTDSGLVQDVIQPGFERAYPQYRLQYVAVGTGQALTNARNGQADAVLTHAPTAEAQFVADGFSAEPTGRAIMFNDYVITGRQADPAGVRAGASRDAIRAFELIAAAGAGGTAVFVSRGDNSGTHIQEGLMWALSDVPTHPIGAANSGREEPDANGDGTGTDIPAWYQKAGVGQAATVKISEQCSFGGGSADRCYSMTDRGTYDRQTQIGAINGIGVLTERNLPTARGGEQLLTNPFRAYAVNPAKFASVNLAGGTAFLDYLTSEAFQTALDTYPSAANQRFFPDAFPRLDLAGAPIDTRINAGESVTLTGTLFNRYPGAGAVGGAPLVLQGSLGLAGPLFPVAPAFADLARATSDGGGRVSLTGTPNRSGALRAVFSRFGELSPTSYPVGTVRVGAVVNLRSVDATYRRVRLRGESRPGTGRDTATLSVVGRRLGGGAERQVAQQRLTTAGEGFDLSTALDPGRWRLRVRYSDPRAVEPGESRTVEVLVPGAAKVRLNSVRRLRDRRVRVSGTVTPAARGSAVRVRIDGRRLGRGRSRTYRQVASVRPRNRSRRFTATFRLSPGLWQLRSRYRNPGVIDTATSPARRVSVR